MYALSLHLVSCAGPVLDVAALTVCSGLGGVYLARVFTGRETWLGPAIHPLAAALTRLAGPDAQRDMTWRDYAQAALLLSALMFVIAYLCLSLTGIAPAQAFVMACTTITGGAHRPEGPLAGGLGWLAAGVNLAVFAAVARGLLRGAGKVGNFWTDLILAVLAVILPLMLARAAWNATAGALDLLDQWRANAMPNLQAASAQLTAAALSPAPSNVAALLIAATLLQGFACMAGRPRLGLLVVFTGLSAASLMPPAVFTPAGFGITQTLSVSAAVLALGLHFWLLIPALAVAGSPLRLPTLADSANLGTGQ